MAQTIDDQSTSGSALVDDGTDSVTVITENADRLFIFIDDDADTPADHDGYELTIEVQGDVDGTTRFQEYMTIGGDGVSAETARSWDLPAVPDKMKITLTNRAGSTADHAMRVVSVKQS